MKTIAFTLNGVARSMALDEDRILLWVLRDDLALTGTKFGCGAAYCGSCTVLVDGKAVRACTTTMKAVEGKKVVTIEGLAEGERLHPVQEAFIEHLGFQCGYCTSGMIMGGAALLHSNPKPSRAEITQGLERHICRCGAQVRIVDAIEAASTSTVGGAR